jgi:hypothetical protein
MKLFPTSLSIALLFALAVCLLSGISDGLPGWLLVTGGQVLLGAGTVLLAVLALGTRMPEPKRELAKRDPTMR